MIRPLLRYAAVLALLFGTAAAGCSSNRGSTSAAADTTASAIDDPPDMVNKMDAALRMRIAEIERSSSDEPVHLLVKISEPAQASHRDQLETAGLHVRDVVGDIVTASGDVDAIRKAASLPLVLKLSLAQTREAK